MKYSVIITAGGIGKRFGSSTPKQFISINGLPVIMHTIRVFHTYIPEAQLLITLPEDWINYWQELVQTYHFEIPVEVVGGGSERYDSVKNALSKCKGEYVLVHDAVRPMVNQGTIKNCLDALEKNKAVIPVLKVKDSLRRLSDSSSQAVKRDEYCLVQTPQCFEALTLRAAYDQSFRENITDDASLVERMGIDINLVEGNEENIKITTPQDLKIATLMMTDEV
jgi:2-C-methyl-D-erythritol 4-phosphate cytidylyltransferase